VFSQVLEEGEKLVIRPISPRLAVERCDPVENPLLQLKVGVQVDLNGLDRLMAEPQRNDTWLGTVLEKVHRRRVSPMSLEI
jgi:hypothetical protein